MPLVAADEASAILARGSIATMKEFTTLLQYVNDNKGRTEEFIALIGRQLSGKPHEELHAPFLATLRKILHGETLETPEFVTYTLVTKILFPAAGAGSANLSV